MTKDDRLKAVNMLFAASRFFFKLSLALALMIIGLELMRAALEWRY